MSGHPLPAFTERKISIHAQIVFSHNIFVVLRRVKPVKEPFMLSVMLGYSQNNIPTREPLKAQGEGCYRPLGQGEYSGFKMNFRYVNLQYNHHIAGLFPDVSLFGVLALHLSKLLEMPALQYLQYRYLLTLGN